MNYIDFTNWKAVNRYVKDEQIDFMYNYLMNFFAENNFKTISYHMRQVAIKGSKNNPKLIKVKTVCRLNELIQIIKESDFSEIWKQ